MKKTLVGLLVGVVGLGVLTWLVTREEPVPAPEILEIPGYASEEELAEAESGGMFQAAGSTDHPIDELVVEGASGTLHLVRRGEGDDAAWRLKEPVDAPATSFRVDRMVRPFRDETTSIYSTELPAEDLPLYDLEPERRIAVTLRRDGEVWEGVDLLVGKVETSEAETVEGEAAKDTWVAVRGEEDRVYRIGGKDLRSPFEVEASELRDKRVFDVEPSDLVRLVVEPPGGGEVVLEGERTEEAPAREGAEPTFEITWILAKPEGYETGDGANALARSLATLRAQAFVAVEEAPAEALGGESWTLRAETFDGRTVALALSAADEDPVWARVEGADEYLKLASSAAKKLRKTTADLRDRRLLPIDASEVTRLRFAGEDGGAVIVERRAESWAFVKPRQPIPADADERLGTLLGAKAKRFARADEMDRAVAAVRSPEHTAEVRAGARSWGIAFGPSMDEEPYGGHRWAVVSAGGEAGDPMLVQDHMARRFVGSVNELQRKRLFDLDADDIQRVEVSGPAVEGVVLERDPGSGDMVPAGLPEGKTPKAQAIRTLVTTLAKVKARALKPDAKPGDHGLVEGQATRVVARLADGGEVALLLAPKQGDAGPFGLAETGPLAGVVVTLNEFQVKNLQKPPTDLFE